MNSVLSFHGGFIHRLWAMVLKELRQIRRDRVTFAMMIMVPFLQIMLFGYAINLEPQNLPTAVAQMDDGPFGRALVSALQTSGYFRVTHQVASGEEIDTLLQAGDVQFGIEIPADFSRRLVAGERPSVRLAADDTAPAAVGAALGVVEKIARSGLQRELRGDTANLRPGEPPAEVIVQRLYNPSQNTRLVIIPALLGVILMLALMIFTALGVTRELERGTMEQLLSMPLSPLEIMLGKILPYVGVGVVQSVVVLGAAFLLFDVPMRGSPVLLAVFLALFILATLTIGYLISTLAKTQLQAMQFTIFFYLPNILLSGFAFPFRGMPDWAQVIGEVLPLTHFIRLVRGVMLKGAGVDALWPEISALCAFTLVVMALALLRFRRTLD